MKQCKLCGNDFEPKNPKGVFCSDACRQKDYRAKIAGKLGFLKKLEADSAPKVVSPELLDQIAENNLPANKERILKERKEKATTMDEAGKYMCGVDPHSTDPSKAKIVVYKKKKPLKGSNPTKQGNTANSYPPATSEPKYVSQEEFHDNITGQVQKAETPRPKDWDTMGRIAQMKWLTANR